MVYGMPSLALSNCSASRFAPCETNTMGGDSRNKIPQTIVQLWQKGNIINKVQGGQTIQLTSEPYTP